MPDDTVTIADLREAVRRFNAERHWESYHNPKNLAMGLACEAAEVMEHFLWVDCESSRQLIQDPVALAAIGDELADVACHVFNLTNALGIDLSHAVKVKMGKNAVKYPAPAQREEST